MTIRQTKLSTLLWIIPRFFKLVSYKFQLHCFVITYNWKYFLKQRLQTDPFALGRLCVILQKPPIAVELNFHQIWYLYRIASFTEIPYGS